MTLLDNLRRHCLPLRAETVHESVSEHFAAWFGPDDGEPFRESFIDICCIPPSEQRPYRVLHTNGMASRPLKTRPGQEALAELMMLLPAEDAYCGGDAGWAVRELRRFAHMFHDMSTGVSEFLTLPLSEPAPGTPFHSLMTVRPLFLPPAFHQIDLARGQSVHLFALMPLHMVEVKYMTAVPEPSALWDLAQAQHRDPLELCTADIRRLPVA